MTANAFKVIPANTRASLTSCIEILSLLNTNPVSLPPHPVSGSPHATHLNLITSGSLK